MIAFILNLPRFNKQIIAITVDVFLCILTVWLTYCLVFNELLVLNFVNPWLHGDDKAMFLSIAIAIPIFTLAGLYRTVFRYSGWAAVKTILWAGTLYGFIFFSIFTVIGLRNIPRSVGVIQPLLLLISIACSRVLASYWLGREYRIKYSKAINSKILIYGAGAAGRELALAVKNNAEVEVVGFLDDDRSLHQAFINGLKVYRPDELIKIIHKLDVNEIYLALPNISAKRKSEIFKKIHAAKITVKTLPPYHDLINGKVKISDLRELDINDLLGRDSILPNQMLLAKSITGKVVMVTGAGGSIGSELCRQITDQKPSKLLLVEINEYALYSIHHEIEKKIPHSDLQLIPLLVSVQDKQRMAEIMKAWSPDTVYHAAAYKHVPLVEQNPIEGIQNNVFGTLSTALAAAEHRVKDFVLVSTDKAVRPTNIMGASKRLAELCLQALAAEHAQTRFSMVRFGNVLGSSGSVVPKFREQIQAGGPLTLTHLEITRYFMTIPEAAQLVLQAAGLATGGDVFVLDMGESVKIIDLAKKMLELSGLTIKDANHQDGDIEIKITGLRPGEKLYEELLIGNNPEKTIHPKILKAHENFISWLILSRELSSLEESLKNRLVIDAIDAVKKLVPEYNPAENISDWIYLQNKKFQ
jgi:FlaA1/EpsC-like NDP-sugar epimerase